MNFNRLRTRAFPPEPKSLLKNDRKPNTKLPGPRAVVAVAAPRALRLQSRVYICMYIFCSIVVYYYYIIIKCSPRHTKYLVVEKTIV